MKNALSLAPRLASARLRGAKGGAVLDVFAVVAFTVATLLALTVAGGTWMFLEWSWNGNPEMAANLGISAWDAAEYAQVYVILAALACALIVVPILSLGGSAARLGARGRASRLASLRLVGMTGGEVVAMSVVETVVQAVVGMALGTVLWLATLPAWGLISFQSVSLTPSLMRGPWWLWLAVWGVILVLAIISTIAGLRRVRISPLGVANRQTPPALKAWRLVAFAVAAIAAIIYVQNTVFEGFREMIAVAGVIAAFIGGLMLVINLVGPWVIQLIARMRTRTDSVPMLLAARRLAEDPKAAWRNVSALALLGFLGAFAVMMPTNSDELAIDDPMGATMYMDLRTGVLITLAMGFVVGAVSTLISQSASVVDRADESRSLDRMGVPREVFAKMRRRQVLLPLIVTLAVAVGLGLLLSSPFLPLFVQMGSVNPLMLVGVIAFGIGLTLIAAEACRPVQTAILDQAARRND